MNGLRQINGGALLIGQKLFGREIFMNSIKNRRKFFRIFDFSRMFPTFIVLCVLFSGLALSDDGQLSNSYYIIDKGDFQTSSSHTSSSIYDSFSILQTQPEMRLTSSAFALTTGLANFIPWNSLLNPIVSAIDPVSGYNIAPVHITKVQGINFSGGIVLKLTASGEVDIAAANIVVVNTNEINCDFDLTGAKAGYWNVVVSKDANPPSTLPNGFEVKSYSYPSTLAINSPNPFDNRREGTTIAYRLDKDTDVNVYIFSTTGNLIWKDVFLSGANGGRAGDNSIVWDGVSYFSEVLSNGVYLLHIVEKQTGKTLAKGKIMIIRR